MADGQRETYRRMDELYDYLKEADGRFTFTGLVFCVKSRNPDVYFNVGEPVYDKLKSLGFIFCDRGPVYEIVIPLSDSICQSGGYYTQKYFFTVAREVTPEMLRDSGVPPHSGLLFTVAGCDLFELRRAVTKWWLDNDSY